MNNKNVNDLFEIITPQEKQKEKMLEEILTYKKHRFTNKEVERFWRNKNFKIALLACSLCFVLVLGLLPHYATKVFPSVKVYAYGSNDEITNSGAKISTGRIYDDGKMQGTLLYLYVTGDGIKSIRYSCVNQYLEFTDWTEQRENHSKEKSFTVSYGKNTDEYPYLVVYWTPELTIRALTDNKNIGIKGLSDELREETLIMEVTFENGKTLNKAVRIRIQDDGIIFAKLDDASNKDLKNIKAAEKTNFQPYTNNQKGVDQKESKETVSNSLTEEEIEKAKKAAEAYYKNTSFKIVSIEYDATSFILGEAYLNDKYSTWKLAAFKVYEKAMYPDIARAILLGRESKNSEWIVLNEGY